MAIPKIKPSTSAGLIRIMRDKQIEAATISSEVAEKHPLIEVDPDQCYVTPLNGRSEESLNESSLDELLDSIKTSGQLTPARGFWNKDGKVEILAGRRRHAAARILGRKLQVHLVTQPEVEQQIVQLYHENQGRTDYSVIEQGREFTKALTVMGVSQNQLADILGVTHMRISRAVRVFSLPPEILDLYKHKESLLTLMDGLELVSAFDKGPAVAEPILALARTIKRADSTTAAKLLKAAEAASAKPKPAAVEKIRVRGKVLAVIRGGGPGEALAVQVAPDADQGLKEAIRRLITSELKKSEAPS